MKAMKWVALAAAIAAGLVLTGCGGGQGDEGGETGAISIQGSDTMVNLSQAWSEAFMTENPGVIVTVNGGGSGTGIASLINGTVDFANASRQIKDEESEQAEAAGIDVNEIEVAKDGIAVLVNPENQVTELSMDQLGKVYRGEITNWKELGGQDAPIVLLGRDTSSGTYEYFKEEVVGDDAEYAKSMKNLQSSQAIVDEVSRNANAIGYVGVGYVNDSVAVAKIDGTAASTESILDGSYVLSRGLYMYANGEPEGAKKTFVDWILSEPGQAVVEDQGFVPVAQ